MTAGSGDEAVDNGRGYSSYDTGMCQKYVRGPCWEVGSLYGSAIEAWNGATEKHPGDRNPPIGAPVYYSGGSYGHAVIYVGNGNVRSTDTPSSGGVGEKPIAYYEGPGWNKTFLGWTGDINGVDLPLSGDGDDDMPLSKEDAEKVADAVWNRLLSGQPDTDESRKAWATLVNAFGQAYEAAQNGAENVWARMIAPQDDAPEGRRAEVILNNIHNMVRDLHGR
jgi:hypothetical protein